MSQMFKRLEATAKTHLNNIMQIAIFKLNDGNHYGINVSKIKSFEDYKKYNISKRSNDTNAILSGYIEYQKKIIPILNLEKWLGCYEEGNRYLEYVVCEYNDTTVAFPIAGIDNIHNIPTENLQQPEGFAEEYATYNTIQAIEGEQVICSILDVEKLLLDTFGMNFDTTIGHHTFNSDKQVLIAEDSRTARTILDEVLKQTDLRYKFFNDGKFLMDALKVLNESEKENIGLIITDLEMPRKDGFQVIQFIQETPTLKQIPILVNSSMSNKGVEHKTESLGVKAFISKTDPRGLIGAIKQFMIA